MCHSSVRLWYSSHKLIRQWLLANNKNQLALVTAQQQQADAFNALATTTEQRKYDALFAAVSKFDGTNKEDCAVWLSRITSLVATTGRDLHMELFN